MDDTIFLEKLTYFGLTRQEAAIYLCLYRNGELTGYEVAKLTGISRSNVYSGLSDLTEKGAAYLTEGNVNRYVAVPMEEFCRNKLRFLDKTREFLVENIPCVKQSEPGYVTIEGDQNIWNKILNMLETTKMRIYLSAKAFYVDQLSESLENMAEQGIKLVLITDGEISSVILKQKAKIYLGESRKNTIHLITDSEFALTGELKNEKGDTCLYTGQTNFIRVFKEMLRNEMKLIEMDNRKGNECK